MTPGPDGGAGGLTPGPDGGAGAGEAGTPAAGTGADARAGEPTGSRLPRPTDVLPHRDPFLFVDEVTELVTGTSARGRWRLRGDEAFFTGHFPGRPTLPGVLMVEAMAQLGAVAILSDPRFQGKLPLFGGIDKARFRRQVVPGDTLELEVTLDQIAARAGKGSGTARVGGQVAATVGLLFVIADA